MALLERIQRERNMALVVITHEPEIARRARRTIELRDGLVVSDGRLGPAPAAHVPYAVGDA
jgi:putative ABC transport system ATP-binding protein